MLSLPSTVKSGVFSLFNSVVSRDQLRSSLSTVFPLYRSLHTSTFRGNYGSSITQFSNYIMRNKRLVASAGTSSIINKRFETTQAKQSTTPSTNSQATPEKWTQPTYLKHPIPNPIEEACFAIVHLSGAQHKITPGDVLITEKLDAEVGDEIVLDKVLLLGTKTWTAIGTPMVENAKVYAVVEEQSLTDRIIVFKKKRRKNYRRTKGHRQDITTLRITGVSYDTSKK